MNIVIIYGRIVSKIEFKFIYDRYKEKDNIKEKYKHTSIAKCKIRLENDSIVEVYGYDNIADYMYRYMKENEEVLIEGKIDGNMKIEIIIIKPYNLRQI